ncbi:MAG TPA: CBS domain-containing protein [Sedimentisphaerales bacterium]|nr:CBS domain-containing protein [Sedimentisphaerales bacterium]
MLKAKDIMTEVVVSVRPDMPVQKAVKLLLANEIAGVPVVEKDMTLVGIVTEKDLLKLFNEPESADAGTVAEFMTQPAVHFEEDESLDDICKCLLEMTFRRVPVTRDGKVVGIVSRPDVLRCILKQIAQRVNP